MEQWVAEVFFYYYLYMEGKNKAHLFENSLEINI